MTGITSRERVLAALRHQEADRVPIDLGAMRSSGIHAIAYNRLKAHLGMIGGQTVLYDIMQQLAQPEPAIVDRFSLDVLPLPRAVIGLDPSRPRWKAWRLPDRSPALIPEGLVLLPSAGGGYEIHDESGRVLYQMPAGGLYFDTVYEPLADARTVSDIAAWQPPTISDAELRWLHGEARRLRSTTGKAIMGLTGLKIYEGAQTARGWQRFMEDLGAQPALAEALLQRLADSACTDLARYLDAVGEFIDIVQVGDDLGTQNGPQLSVRMYRRLVKPYQQQVWEFIKARSGLPVFLHCCGGIYPFIPDLIEAGVDILNPVQVSAAAVARTRSISFPRGRRSR
jgi:uroporphyrinogen decarboxylase